MKKLSIVLLLLALVLAVVPAALAQDTLNASPEDYATWTGANEATFSASSMSFEFTVSLAVAGMSGDSSDDMTATLVGSGIIINNADDPGLLLDVTGASSDGGETTPLTLEVRIVNGNVYLSEDGESWQFMSLDDVSSMLGDAMSGSGLPIDPSMLSGDMSGMGDMADMMAGFEDMQGSDFLTLTRTGDTYMLSLDIAALISSPALAPIIAGAMGGSSGQEMTDAQMQQMAAMMGAMFSNAVVELIQTVDSGSGMVTTTTLNIDIPLDIVAPGAGVTLNFTLNLSGFGETYTIEVPEGAEPVSS